MAIDGWGFRVLLPVVAYLAGSVPFGVLFARWMTGVDVRIKGSRNIGATNVRRVAGIGPALLTLAADTAKGAVPVWVARAMLPEVPVFWVLVALAAFTGHLFPFVWGFKGGGKGVATAGGGLLAITPPGLLAALLVFVAVAWWSNRASVASLAAASILPVIIWGATRTPSCLLLALVMTSLIWWRHRPNIRRLLAGTEPGIRSAKKRG